MALQSRAFIVGPNASGKSNLLDSLRFLAEIARHGSGGLGAAIQNRGGFSSIRCLHARNPGHVEIDVSIGNDASPNEWQYQLQINRIGREVLSTVTNESILKNGKKIKTRRRSDSDDPLEFSQTLLEQVNSSKDFRDLVAFLASCRYLHVVPQIVRDRERAKKQGEDPFGGDLLRRIKDTPQKTRLPRLRRISEALQVAVPQFGEIALEDDPDGVPHLSASFIHWRDRPTRQYEGAFSDGTLRLVGLLWSIAENGGPLFLEEPELSLNDAVVGELPRMFSRMQRFSRRQILASTHSISILDDPNISLKEVHRIYVNENGSSVETLFDNKQVSAQVRGEMTISQAVLPLLRPEGIDRLGMLDVAR
jgi:predicted ATPase